MPTVTQHSDEPNPAAEFELALLSDIGSDRANNEDSCGQWVEGRVAVFAVADGVGGYEGGEVASRMAVDVTLAAFKESPAEWGVAKRLQRAVQRANIEIYNRAITVPELRRMATTLTAAAVGEGLLSVAHVGDCRLYLVRSGQVQQMTKDHTWVGERVRMGMMSAREARNHPERSALSRCMGRELIVSVDRLAMPLIRGDQVILCSDGLHGVIDERELPGLLRGASAEDGCKRLIDTANARGTADNLTVAVFRMLGGAAMIKPRTSGWGRLLRFFRRA